MDRLSQLRVVKSALDACDPEGLLAAGCPSDEYDEEASLIEARIALLHREQNAPTTLEQIASAVADVWSKQFGPFSAGDLKRRRPSFLDVAKRIVAQR
jgi:hypothetical protein